MIAQYDLTIFDDRYGELARIEKDKIWEEALLVLSRGRDVVLDWSLWNRRARAEWSGKIVESGHSYKLVFLKVPLEELNRRLSQRNSDPSAQAHDIPLEELERFRHFFEPPTADEELVLEVIGNHG